MHLLVYESAKNNSMKVNLRVHFMFHLKEQPRFSFREHLKLQKCEEKDIFDVVIDGLLDSAVEGVLEGAPRDEINDLYKDPQEASIICKCKQNFVNVLFF